MTPPTKETSPIQPTPDRSITPQSEGSACASGASGNVLSMFMHVMHKNCVRVAQKMNVGRSGSHQRTNDPQHDSYDQEGTAELASLRANLAAIQVGVFSCTYVCHNSSSSMHEEKLFTECAPALRCNKLWSCYLRGASNTLQHGERCTFLSMAWQTPLQFFFVSIERFVGNTGDASWLGVAEAYGC